MFFWITKARDQSKAAAELFDSAVNRLFAACHNAGIINIPKEAA